MARKKLQDEFMTEEQKKRREYNENYRNKEKLVLSKNSARNEKKYLRKTKIVKLINEENSQMVNIDSNKKIINLVGYENSNEKNDVSNSNVVDLFTKESFSLGGNQISTEQHSVSHLQLLSRLEALEKENHELRNLLVVNVKQEVRSWNGREALKKVLNFSAVVTAHVAIFLLLTSLIVLLAAGLVTLSSDFYEKNLHGFISAGAILFGSAFFSFMASRAGSLVSRWGARTVSLGIISMNLLFSMNGLLDRSLRESGSFQSLTGEIGRLKADIELDSKQISMLPETYTSARDKVKVHKDSLEGKLKTAEAKLSELSPKAADPIKVAQPFMVRFVLEVVLLMLLEMFFRRIGGIV